MDWKSQHEKQRRWAEIFDYVEAYDRYRTNVMTETAAQRPNWPLMHLQWWMDKCCWLQCEYPILAYDDPVAKYTHPRPIIAKASEALTILHPPPPGPLLPARELPIRTFGGSPFHDYETILVNKTLRVGQEHLCRQGWNGAGMGLGRIGRCDPVTGTDRRGKGGIGYSSDMVLARDSLRLETWSPRLGIVDNGYRRPSQRIGFLADSNTPPPPPSPPPSFYLARRLLELQTSTVEVLTMVIDLPPTEPQAPTTVLIAV